MRRPVRLSRSVARSGYGGVASAWINCIMARVKKPSSEPEIEAADGAAAEPRVNGPEMVRRTKVPPAVKRTAVVAFV